ncbi:retrovirus-related Pol polyprotein from transposon 17.6 [Trichonephila clavipes]|nr:retrovirus-related Pol polyprotein from transposon 17.6 [Trichonephila clavipes]
MAPRLRRAKGADHITSGSSMSKGRFDLSTFRSERTNEASTLIITPKRSSSRDVAAIAEIPDLQRYDVENGNSIRNAFVFSAENSASNSTHNSKSDLLQNRSLISSLDVMKTGSMKISFSAVKATVDTTLGLVIDIVILNNGQVMKTTPELALPLLTTTLHQWEDVCTFVRFSMHYSPTRRVCSGTRKYNESRLVDHARFNDETDNENHNDEIINAALIEEFEDLFCSYDVHKEMQKRKLRPTESLFEYFLAMREIASKAHFHLDDHSLIMYCITGIPDSNHNKLILYACKSISEFKEKLKIYEKIFMQNNSYCIDNENKRTKFKQYDFPTSNKNTCSDNKFHNKDEFNDANVNKSDVRIRCYNCGLFNHTSNECYHKNKGLKCFNCNQFGHKRSQCVFKKPDVKNEIVNEIVSEVVNEINSSSEMRTTVKINGYDFDALIDTGSTIVLLIRESVYQILGRPTLNPTKINLTSFGKSEIKTFGSFKSHY